MTDITVTAGSVVAGANAATDTGVAGETITAGKLLYKSSSTGKWMLADNDSAITEAQKAVGMALNGASLNQPLVVLKSGDVTMNAALTAGTAYYLSSTPGGICPVADLASGKNVCQVGLAKSTTVLAVSFQTPGVVL